MAGARSILGNTPLLQFLYQVKRGVLRVTGMRTRGVKVLVANRDGHVLLIRNSYGNRRHFVFPGGGVRPFEAAQAAAVREVKEEVGIRLESVALFSTHNSRLEGKRDTILLYHARADANPNTDSIEVEEAAFYALDALPANLSPATARRLAEWRDNRPADGPW